jgi:GTP-binding protein Era
MRYGTIAIIGRTNVGKSTFLNSVLGMPLAIVSPQPQTTRDSLLGVVNTGEAQLAFVDTPGLHRPKNELGRRMNQEAADSLRNADVAVFMTDIYQIAAERKLARAAGLSSKPDAHEADSDETGSDEADADEAGSDEADADEPATARRAGTKWGSGERGDVELIETLPAGLPTILVVNKIDRLRDKGRLLPFLQTMNARHPFAATVPISALAGDGVERVLSEVAQLLPEREGRFKPDEVTDRPVSFFAREYIREQVLATATREVPHAVAVTLDSIVERPTGLHVSATIHVEKVGQRSILVGRGGEKIKEIGTQARLRLAELAEQPVHLKLFVRVTERWRDMPRQLAELGYAPAPERG